MHHGQLQPEFYPLLHRAILPGMDQRCPRRNWGEENLYFDVFRGMMWVENGCCWLGWMDFHGLRSRDVRVLCKSFKHLRKINPKEWCLCQALTLICKCCVYIGGVLHVFWKPVLSSLITLKSQPSHLGKMERKWDICLWMFFCLGGGGAGRAEKTSRNNGSPTEAFSHSLAQLQVGSFNRSERHLPE